MTSSHQVARASAFAFALMSISGVAQVPVVGPEFSALVDGRPFEPQTVFARIERSPAGDSIRVFVDEVASNCDELDETRGRRVLIGPFAYRSGRSLPAATSDARHVRIDPDGSIRAGRFDRGTIVIRQVGRDAPAVPFELGLELDDVTASNSFVRGDVFVTPCLFVTR